MDWLCRIKIEPAKPFEKKSELMKKYSVNGSSSADPAAAAAAAAAAVTTAAAPPPEKAREKMSTTKNGAAYQVMFDENDRIKTRKATAGIPVSKLPHQKIKQGPKTDLRLVIIQHFCLNTCFYDTMLILDKVLVG